MARDVCYYDGRCGLCRRSKRILSALDWLGNLKWVDQTQVPPGELPVDVDIALSGMPMRTAEGRVLVGFPAMRRALLRTPVGFLPAALMYLPGLNWLGGRAYRWVALNRRRDAVCATGVGAGGGVGLSGGAGGMVEGGRGPADTAA